MAENGTPKPAISADGQFAVQVRVEQVEQQILVVLGISCGPIAQSLYVDPKTARVIGQTLRDAAANAETTLVKPAPAIVQA
jgi:hypothetical protein